MNFATGIKSTHAPFTAGIKSAHAPYTTGNKVHMSIPLLSRSSNQPSSSNHDIQDNNYSSETFHEPVGISSRINKKVKKTFEK
jgi:hypothetical protein